VASASSTAIESGLFNIQAKRLLRFRQRQDRQNHQKVIESMYQIAVSAEADMAQDRDELASNLDGASPPSADRTKQADLTRTFMRLANQQAFPLDRLSRYEATLWRQARQVLFALQFLGRRKPWERMRPRLR